MAILGIGAAIAGGGFFAAAIDFGASIAASIGLSYAARALAGNQQTESHFSTQGQMQASGTSPRTFILGLAATAGLLVYANTWGTSDDGKSPNAYFTQVIKVSDIPVKGLNRVWVGDELCTIDTGTVTDKGSPLLEYRKDGKDHVWVKFYDGTQTTGDTFLATKVRSDDRPYEANRVGVGCAYVIATALVEDTLFTGLPQFKFEIDGIRLYDPTKDSTNGGDGAQRFTDPATWGGDGDYLTAVQAYNVLRGIRYNGAWMFGLQKTVQANLPPVNWNTQIAKCRATITRASGDEPTYRSAGQITVDTPAADALDALMTACHGKISEVGGFYKVHLGEPDSPSFSFTDDDILSTEEQNFDPFLQLADSINGITGSYPDPDQAWNPASAPAIYNAGFEAIDGSRRLLANPSFDLVPYGGQVQQLMRSALNAARRERSHRLVMPPVFWLVEPGDVGTWTSARNGYDNKSFEATAVSDKDNLDIGLSLQECDPSDYSWDHTSDYTPVPVGPTGFVRPAPQGISDWSVVGDSDVDSDGFKRFPIARLAWDNTIPGIIGIRWQIRLKSNQAPVTADSFTLPGISEIKISQSMLSLTEYEMATQYVPSAPRDMLWSEWRTFTTPDARLAMRDIDEGLGYQLTTVLDGPYQDLRKQIAKATTIATQALARTFLDKKQVRTQQSSLYGSNKALIEEVQTTAADADAAMAENIRRLFAGANGAEGEINQTATTLASTNVALGQLDDEVTAKIGPSGSITSTVATHASAIAQLDGYAASQWTALVTVDGSGRKSVAGIVLMADSANTSAFSVNANNFFVTFPDAAGGDPVPVYTIANVNGVAKCVLRGDMWVDGGLITRMIAAGAITTVTFAAQSVDTAALSINSVGLDQIITNAITNTKSFAFADQVITLSAAGSYMATITTNTVNIQSGKACITCATSFASAAGKSTCGLNSGSANAMFVDLLVDGSLVYSCAGGWIDKGSFTFENGSAVFAQYTVSGLSAGNHTFAVRIRYSGSTDFRLTPSPTVPVITLCAGELRVQDFRNG